MKLRYRLLLVRHGQAHSNQRGAFLGRRDDSLTELGQSQAASLGERMAGESVDLMVSSPLKRALETARVLATRILAEEQCLETDDLLMEQDYGQWDGLTFPDVKKRFSQDFQAWMTGDSRLGPTGGENLDEVSIRVKQCRNHWIPKIPEGGSLMWVSHAGVIQTLLCQEMGLKLCNQWPFMPAPGSLAELQMFGTGPRLTRFSWV